MFVGKQCDYWQSNLFTKPQTNDQKNKLNSRHFFLRVIQLLLLIFIMNKIITLSTSKECFWQCYVRNAIK